MIRLRWLVREGKPLSEAALQVNSGGPLDWEDVPMVDCGEEIITCPLTRLGKHSAAYPPMGGSCPICSGLGKGKRSVIAERLRHYRVEDSEDR